jgi:hypothetical protein
VNLDTRFTDPSQQNVLGPPQCPPAKFTVKLMNVDKDFEVSSTEMSLGAFALEWEGLPDGQYQLEFERDKDDPKCCLAGDILVTKFFKGGSTRA